MCVCLLMVYIYLCVRVCLCLRRYAVLEQGRIYACIDTYESFMKTFVYRFYLPPFSLLSFHPSLVSPLSYDNQTIATAIDTNPNLLFTFIHFYFILMLLRYTFILYYFTLPYFILLYLSFPSLYFFIGIFDQLQSAKVRKILKVRTYLLTINISMCWDIAWWYMMGHDVMCSCSCLYTNHVD